MRYYIYRPTNQGKKNDAKSTDMTPILFTHGIGIGNLPYYQFLQVVKDRFPHRTIVLVSGYAKRHTHSNAFTLNHRSSPVIQAMWLNARTHEDIKYRYFSVDVSLL